MPKQLSHPLPYQVVPGGHRSRNRGGNPLKRRPSALCYHPRMPKPRSSAHCILFRFLVCVSLVAFAAAGCGNRDGGQTIELTDCRLPKLSSVAHCGTVKVPEDRSRTGGREIGIAVAVLRANTLSPDADPLFMLAGGPGQSA